MKLFGSAERRTQAHSTDQSPIQPSSVNRLDGEHVETDPEHLFAEVVNDRIAALNKAHNSFLRDAVDKGIPAEVLPEAVADAMNAGMLPRVTLGPMNRNSEICLRLLNGQIPADMITVRADTADDGSIAYSVGAMRVRADADSDFSTEDTTFIPQSTFDLWHNPMSIDPAELMDKIDAYFPVGTVNTARIIEKKPEVALPQDDDLTL